MNRVTLTERAARECRELPPEIRREAREALRELEADPFAGKPLEKELAGHHTFRFMRYRIVYRTDAAKKLVIVVGIGHRSSIYERIAEWMRTEGRPPLRED